MNSVHFQPLTHKEIGIGAVELFVIHREENSPIPRWRQREQYAINFIVKGQVEYTFDSDGADFSSAGEGDLVFFPIGTKYAVKMNHGITDFYTIRFRVIDGGLDERMNRPLRIKSEKAHEIISSVFRSDIDACNPYQCYSAIYQLLMLFEDEAYGASAPYQRLQRAIDHILKYFHEQNPISFYAALCDMSVTNFRRLFVRYYGKTPIAYRNDIRLEKARALLRSNLANVSETARACGFESLSFFCKLYKQKFGYSPKKEVMI